MAVEIIMPELGESVHEATVNKWLKKEGDLVHEDEPLVEIMTDKINTELPSPATGTLAKIFISDGGSVEVFAPLGVIHEVEEVKSTSSEKMEQNYKPKELGSIPTAVHSSLQEKIQIAENMPAWYTPVVRSIANEHHLSDEELKGIQGSGEGGRVTKKDLENYLSSKELQSQQNPIPETTNAKLIEQTSPGSDQEIRPLVGMRKAIAEAMVKNAQVPVVSTMVEVDVTHMVHFREHNKDDFQKEYGVKLTYTPFFIKSLSEALIEFPLMNASLQSDGNILVNKIVHLGVAVALGVKGEDGLIVPVIRNAHEKGLIELAKDLESIASKARKNTLGLPDIQGGTFTLTNPGSYGAFLGTPMINAPQAGILGTYTIRKMPVVIDEMIAVRSVMNLVLTYDHWLIDGMLAGKFLQSIKKKLENFDFFQ